MFVMLSVGGFNNRSSSAGVEGLAVPQISFVPRSDDHYTKAELPTLRIANQNMGELQKPRSTFWLLLLVLVLPIPRRRADLSQSRISFRLSYC